MVKKYRLAMFAGNQPAAGLMNYRTKVGLGAGPEVYAGNIE